MPSVQPEWCRALPLQQQSVLLLAARGPDGIAKAHPAKEVHRAYRGTVLMAARYGRMLAWGEQADSFMTLHVIANEGLWDAAVAAFFRHSDDLPHHYLMHLYHGAAIIGYKHPHESTFGVAWRRFYLAGCRDLHLNPETEEQLDARLNDWGQEEWASVSYASGSRV